MTEVVHRVGHALIVVAVTAATCAAGCAAQRPVGRDAVAALRFGPVSFEPPEPERYEVAGVPVLLLRDPAVPLVNVFARFKGGYGLFEREYYAAATALPALLRYGGTSSLSPDSVDESLEHFAIQTSFGSAGEAVSASMNVLTEHLATALTLWGSMLREPRFDPSRIEVWRGQELESVRRRLDDPGRLAFSEFNRLLYGDHPIGWEMDEGDLEPASLAPERFAELHRRIVCPENLVLGVTGDALWSEVRPLLEELLGSWPPCEGALPPPPVPEIRHEPGVYVIVKELEQSVIVMAHPTGVRLADDPDYFSATIGNSILGGGGFSSRLLARIRTEEGYAYSASSLWTTPRRFDGLLGAITRTRPENAVPAIHLILETMEELRAAPPSDEEVGTAVDRIANGFVFNFETPAQIVSRQMFYLAQDLPADWLERFLRGVQQVTPGMIHDAFAEHLWPGEMTILIVGDLDRIGRAALEELGPVTMLDASGARSPRR